MGLKDMSSLNTLNPEITPFSYTSLKEQHLTEYDFLTNATELATLGINEEYHTPEFLIGNVAKMQLGLATTSPKTYYSYDVYGRVAWVVQYIKDIGAKTINYQYDPVTSKVSKVIYQKHSPSELFIHKYTYNISQHLVRVETSTDDNTYTVHAEYDYYETGSLKRTELGDGIQGIDYIYNLNGQLKAINHPSLLASKDPGGDSNDLFGMTIDYYNNDYMRNSNFSMIQSGDNQFNGNIKGITTHTKWNENTQPTAQYRYSYNTNNWLSEATFSGGNATSPTDYRVQIPQYDANGNIKRLIRNKHTENGSNAMDDFSYVYKNGNTSNQLDHVNDAVIATTYANDLKDQHTNNYTYNEIGQLVDDVQENIRYTYNASGLVTKISAIPSEGPNSSRTLTFEYNERGQRILKKSRQLTGQGSTEYTTYYLRDVSGNIMAIYTGSYSDIPGDIVIGEEPSSNNSSSTTLLETPIYGNGRIGIYRKGLTAETSYGLYQLTDHLGNVRAVINKNQQGTYALVSATDYYPGGMAMPGRQMVGGETYRYAYQGQELDQETGKVAFQLRLYDPRINRWMSPDPMGQYHSPYMAMDNRPNMSIDPTGGCTVGEDCPPEFDWMGAGTWVADEINLSGGSEVNWGSASLTGGGLIDFSTASESTWDNIFSNQMSFNNNLGNITELASDWKDKWSESSNFFSKLSYGFVNDFYVTVQTLNPFDNQLTNFNGTGVVRGSSEHLDNGVNVLTTFVPSSRGAKGLAPLKKLNVAQFSKTFKGNLSRLKPSTRGFLNRGINKQVIRINDKIHTGAILFNGIDYVDYLNQE